MTINSMAFVDDKTTAKSVKSFKSYYHKRKRRFRTGRFRFRALVHNVIANLPWIADTTDLELGDNADLNAYILTHKRGKSQILALENKITLKQIPENRSLEAVASIKPKLDIFKFFRHLPEDIKTKILFHATFRCYTRNRILVKQGVHAEAIYFITYGLLQSDRAENDPIFEKEKVHSVHYLSEGDSVGEVSLLYDEPHAATISVKSKWVELLTLHKENVMALLEPSLKREWTKIRWALSKFPHLEPMPESFLRMACSSSVLAKYKRGDLIPSKDESGLDLTTFIVNGSCKVIQPLYIKEDHTKHTVESRYRLYTKPVTDIKHLPPNVRQVFMEVCTFHRKSVFGLGERLSEHFIIADTYTLALVIPRSVIFRFSSNSVWKRIALNLDMVYPNNDEIYKNYLDSKKWMYCKQQYKAIYSKKTNFMNIHDVPLTERVKHLKLIKNSDLYKTVITMPGYKFGEIDDERLLQVMKINRQNFKEKALRQQKKMEIKSLRRQIVEAEPSFLKSERYSRRVESGASSDLDLWTY